jgi:hypothetical protein
MRKSLVACLIAGASSLAGLVHAQQTAPAAPAASTTPAPAPDPPKSVYSQGGMDFSFLFDGYVNGNFNHPDSGFNQYRNFDYRADTAHVNMGKITIDRAPAPVGFHLDLGFGQTFSAIHATDRAPDGLKYFEQAYISFKPKSFKGVEIDAGQFVTSAGAEVIESNANWNYSRSLLFAWAIPYYHFGVRTTVPIGKFTGGFQVVQGWNNVYDNNSGKTFGFTGSYAWKKVTWSNVYYVGPEKTGTNEGIRHVFDSTVVVNPTDKLSYYINVDYLREKQTDGSVAALTGIAAAMRYQATSKFAFASRAEWFDDYDGFSTGTKQSMQEVTLTGEYKIAPWLVSRVEFRNDWSDKSVFEKGSGTAKSQPTILLGIMAVLGPKK